MIQYKIPSEEAPNVVNLLIFFAPLYRCEQQIPIHGILNDIISIEQVTYVQGFVEISRKGIVRGGRGEDAMGIIPGSGPSPQLTASEGGFRNGCLG